jgi:hypothetical protein
MELAFCHLSGDVQKFGLVIEARTGVFLGLWSSEAGTQVDFYENHSIQGEIFHLQIRNPTASPDNSIKIRLSLPQFTSKNPAPLTFTLLAPSTL